MIFKSLRELRAQVFGNATVNAKGTDNPERWIPNYQAITYTHNENGFRCESFSKESQLPILFLGCSFTEGIGINLQDVWSYRLLEKIKQQKNIDIPYWSLATAGSSIDLQALYLHTFIDQLKPKYIFFLLPPLSRRQFRAFKKPIMFSTSMVVSPLDPLTDLETNTIDRASRLLTDQDYFVLESLKSLMLVNELCNRYQTKLFYTTWDKGLESSNPAEFFNDVNQLNNFNQLTYEFPTIIDRARDNRHAGPITNKNFSDLVFEEIKDKI